MTPNFQHGSDVKLIVSNGGYEALKKCCIRGKAESAESSFKSNNKYYYREESTAYYGNHCVRAYVKTSTGKTYYSNILIVRVR